MNSFDDREPRVTVVDVVTESRGVNDGELDLELTFLELSLDNLNLWRLVQLLVMTLVVVFCRRQFGREKGVNQGGLPQPGLAYSTSSATPPQKTNKLLLRTNNHDGEMRATFCNDFVPLYS